MFRRFLPVLTLALAAPAIGQDVPLPGGTQWAQLSLHERIIIRVAPEPLHTGRAVRDAPLPPPMRWKEKHAPTCLPMQGMTGAAIMEPGTVDLLMANGKRMRAELDEDCPALDFYSGFYLKPTADGKLCADRDAIRSRSGAVCPIRAFQRLVPRD